MKEAFLILLIVLAIVPGAFAQEPKDFGYKLMPEKLVEGTEGLLQIYGLQKNIPIPTAIKDLIVVSSNQEVLKVLDLDTNEDTAITSVKVKAMESGTAKIAIAAPGFASKEFSLTVYDIKQGEQKLLVKTVPDTFTVNGPTKGYFSVELADIDSNPTLAKKDTMVSISTSNPEIVTLIQKELIIKEGEYFAIGELQVNKPGEVSVYAESQNTDSGSSKVKVVRVEGQDADVNEDYIIQLYVIPEKISNFATSSTFAIVQLQTLDGTPVKATDSIPVSLKIDHADPVFNDKRNTEISTINSLMIPAGSTTGFAKLSVKAGVEETYQVNISAEDYLVSEPREFQTVLTPDVDEPLTKLDTIPLLASGNEQLIGVLYPADKNGVALINLQTVESEINSSNRKALTISDDRMEKGSGAKLIYGKLGVTKPNSLEITVLAEETETILPSVFGPEKSELELVAEPLISKVMPKSNFPMATYVKNENEASWYFPDTSNVVMIPNEFVKSTVQTISEGQSVAILDSYSNKEGKGALEFESNEFTTKLDLVTGISKPSTIKLAYPDHLLSGMKNTLSLQILDSSGNPIFANKDIEFKMATNDNTIKLPTVTIKKGTYNTFFDIIPNQKTITEISVLASDFPLSKFSLNTVETDPSLIISTVNTIEAGKPFDLVLDAKILDVPIGNVEVKWDIQGAEIQQISEVTDNNGKIKASLIAGNTDKISIKATTADFNQVTVGKEISVTKPGEVPIPTLENSPNNSNSVTPSNPIENNIGFILIPGLVVGGTILVRKRSLLEPLAERFPVIERGLDRIDEIFERFEISERFETIKEKIPIIKNR